MMRLKYKKEVKLGMRRHPVFNRHPEGEKIVAVEERQY